MNWADSHMDIVSPSAEKHEHDNGPTAHFVDIRRITFPVKRAGKVVSFKSSYMGNVRMGADEFKVIFDTGSGHIVVPSVGCTSETCMTHQRYNASASHTGGSIVDLKGNAAVDEPDLAR